MKGTKINLRWIADSRQYKKELNREKMYEVFEGLVNGFEGDNYISKKMISEIIPEADSIFINKDANSTQDVPSIAYKIDGKDYLLKIIRYHKIVWSVLDKYCTV